MVRLWIGKGLLAPPATPGDLAETLCVGRYGPAGSPAPCPNSAVLAGMGPSICAACSAARIAHNRAAFARDLAARGA